jgi:glucose-1-phosphate adenylyltransferase
MDYAAMLNEHKANNADCTIAVLEVPMEEASRFGILNLKGKTNQIEEFEEKPKKPKSNKASMGIYIFTWSVLRKYLVEDEKDPNSENDFGKNIIPNMLNDGQRMFAYKFQGYWKDVGTISSLWEANMDILNNAESGLNLDDDKWKIYARNMAEPPHFVSATGKVQHSMISEGTVVHGTVKDSVISHSVYIGKDAYVEGSIIMPGAVIEDGADVRYSIIGWGAKIGKNAMVGETLENCKPGEWKISVIAPKYELEEGATVGANEMIG